MLDFRGVNVNLYTELTLIHPGYERIWSLMIPVKYKFKGCQFTTHTFSLHFLEVSAFQAPSLHWTFVPLPASYSKGLQEL